MLLLPFLPDAQLTVDGKADESAWSAAAELPDGVPFWPNDAVEPVGALSTRVLTDEHNLYVHFSVADPEPSLVRAGLGRRDSRYADDYVSIQLDPGLTGRRAYRFTANALGVQTDGVHLLGQASYEEDNSWDGLWTSVGRKTPTGWEVEMAIPWSTLQVSREAGRFGLVVARQLARKSHTYAWPKVEPNTDSLLSQASVQGPSGLPARAGLEILPELTGGWSEPAVDTGRLGFLGVSPGLTVRYAPTSNFSASATGNPDFSQIESDSSRIEVNQRYAQSYEEKRPFFLEGQDAFQFPFRGMYYSRSVNAPLYGVRLFGQTGKLSVAGLHALDMLPPPSVNEGGGWTEAQLAGRPALASVVRAQVASDNGSTAGLFLSDRTVLDAGLGNQVAAVDGTLRVGRNFFVEGAALGSATTFEEGEEARLAPAARVAGGWSSDTLYVFTKAILIGEDFRQENGFVTQSDIVGGSAEVHYEFHPGGLVPMLTLEPTDGWAFFDLDGVARERAWDPSIWAQFEDGTFVKLDGRIAGEAFAGGWVDYARAELYTSSAVGEALRLEAEATAGTSPYYDPDNPRAGVLQAGGLGVQVQPTSAVLLALEPGVAHMTELTGEELFLAWTGRARLEIFLNRNAWLRLVADTQGDEAALSAWRVEPLVAYEWTPGRALYLGGAVGEFGDASYWQVFAKASWRFLL
jgi:hypothetical protein